MSLKSKKCGGGPRSPRRDRDATPRQIALSSSLFPSLFMFLLYRAFLSPLLTFFSPFIFDRYIHMPYFRVSVMRVENFLSVSKALRIFDVEPSWWRNEREGTHGIRDLCFLRFNFHFSFYRRFDSFLTGRSLFWIE